MQTRTGCQPEIAVLLTVRHHEFSIERAFFAALSQFFSFGPESLRRKMSTQYRAEAIQQRQLHHLNRALSRRGETSAHDGQADFTSFARRHYMTLLQDRPMKHAHLAFLGKISMPNVCRQVTHRESIDARQMPSRTRWDLSQSPLPYKV